MLHTKTMKAIPAILALFFIASVSYSQEQKVPTYKVPGDSTVYTLRPDTREMYATALVPVADTTAPKPKASEPISYFHLELVVKAIDSGKVTSSRTYTMDANTDRSYHASYRSDTSEGFSQTNRNRTDIDCSDVHLVGTDSISLMVSAMINTSLSKPASTDSDPTELVNATYNGSFYTLATLGKPTTIFSADVQAPNRKIQMEVTATPIRLSTKP
jgi:hypothetical protein